MVLLLCDVVMWCCCYVLLLLCGVFVEIMVVLKSRNCWNVVISLLEL